MAQSIAEQLAESKVYSKTPYIRPGNYLFKVVNASQFVTDENLAGFKVTFEVLEAAGKTPNPEIPVEDWTPNEVGSECAVTVKMATGKYKDLPVKNLKALLIGMVGEEVIAADKDALGKVLTAVFEKGEAKGSLIRCRTTEKRTEAGKGFVGHNWSYVEEGKA